MDIEKNDYYKWYWSLNITDDIIRRDDYPTEDRYTNVVNIFNTNSHDILTRSIIKMLSNTIYKGVYTTNTIPLKGRKTQIPHNVDLLFDISISGLSPDLDVTLWHESMSTPLLHAEYINNRYIFQHMNIDRPIPFLCSYTHYIVQIDYVGCQHFNGEITYGIIILDWESKKFLYENNIMFQLDGKTYKNNKFVINEIKDDTILVDSYSDVQPPSCRYYNRDIDSNNYYVTEIEI